MFFQLEPVTCSIGPHEASPSISWMELTLPKRSQMEPSFLSTLLWGARVNSRPCTLLWSYIPCPEPSLCVYPDPCNRVSYIPGWHPKWSFCVYFLRTSITGMSQTCLVYVVQELKPKALRAAQALYQLSSISRHQLSFLEGKYIEDSEDTLLRYKVELKLLGVSLHLLARCAEGCRDARTYHIWVALFYLTTRTRTPISFYTSQH